MTEDRLRDRLTRGERLAIERRRHRWTQAQAAESHGVSVYVFQRWEKDWHSDPPFVTFESPIQDYEWCFVLRRRSFLTLHQLGELMGLSHKWIHRAERGEVRDVTALVLWWEREEAKT